jgi:hypothetical protein
MKAESVGKNKGIITLEILIAFAIIILNIGAVILVAFGNQSVIIDSETSSEAISKAVSLIEKARAESRYDFNLVNTFSTTETSGFLLFTKKLEVTQIDLFTKKVSSIISWQIGDKTLSTVLTTLLTNPEGVNGGDTCSSVLSGDWKNPQIESVISFSAISPAGIYTLTDIDAYKGKLYATAGKTTVAGAPTLFIFDVGNSGNPELIGQIDNDTASLIGMNSITVTDKYAYAANISRPATTGQLQIFDISASSPLLVKNFPLTGNTATGNSIFYKNKYVFLGTRSSASYEFNIIDVHDPSLPLRKGVYFIGNDVNSILARGNYAYVVSPNTQELQILNIENTDSVTHAGGFSLGSGNGKIAQIVGSKIYFGRTTDGGAGEDFQILDNTNPATTLPRLGGINVSSSVNGIVVRDYLSFLLTGTAGTGSKLQIFKTDDPEHINPWNISALTLSPTGNTTEPSMDCEGNRLYISSNNSVGQGTIYIIKPSNE